MNNAFYYETPIGTITIIDNGVAVTSIEFGQYNINNVNILETNLIKSAKEQLDQYFAGERKVFDIPLEPQGTEFQQKVWKALQEVPYGTTCSYKDIAVKIGNGNASRAVGGANNKNPIAIVIPCHRIIGANGKLVGYAGGVGIKQQLLEIERQNLYIKVDK